MKISKEQALVFIILGAFFIKSFGVIPNFSPVVGAILLGAAYFMNNLKAFWVPFLFLFFSDLMVNNTIARQYYPDVDGIVWFAPYMIWTYLSYGLIILGARYIQPQQSLLRAGGTALGASLLFFLLTNLGAWMDPKAGYSNDFAGLMNSYILAIPFFRISIIGDLVFSLVLFYLFNINYASKMANNPA